MADRFHHTIRKITAAGVVSTLAGTAGVVGSADGSGGAAQFSGPEGIAADTAGNLYVADSSNSTIRKITAAGVVSTLAGTAGVFGNVDGSGGAAQFGGPIGIAVDTAGNLYVVDGNNRTIRKITAAGVVSTLAGTAGGVFGNADGIGGAARFGNPAGIAVDTAGNLYVADYGNSNIRKITLAINLSAEIPVVTQAPPISTFPAPENLLTGTKAFVAANQSQLSPAMRSYIQAEILRLENPAGTTLFGFSLLKPLDPFTKDFFNDAADRLEVWGKIGSITQAFLDVGNLQSAFSQTEAAFYMLGIVQGVVGGLPYAPPESQELKLARRTSEGISLLWGASVVLHSVCYLSDYSRG